MDHFDDRISIFFKELNSALSKIDNTRLDKPFFTSATNFTVIYDAAIFCENELLAIIEAKPFEKKLEIKDYLVGPSIKDLPCKFLIVTNGTQIYIHDNYSGSTTPIESVPQLIERIFNIPNLETQDKIKDEIAQVLFQEVRNFVTLKEQKFKDKIIKYRKVEEHFTIGNIRRHLKYNSAAQNFRLGDDITKEDNFENILFNILLEDVNPGKLIYRYAPLDTVFSTINFEKLRMSGIAGMNDTTEVDYVDHYLDNSYDFTTPSEIKAINNRFITCCSEHDDILNHWRLYGDDCKGACLVFKINPGTASAGLKIKKVSYGLPSKGKPNHPELELLKKLLDRVRSIAGQGLFFKSLGIWKHFFKPYEYKEEKEVRLLMVLNNASNIKGSLRRIKKEWNLTNSHQIIAPYIYIPLNDPILPIELTAITLGSKSPEKQLNQAQLLHILDKKKMGHVKVGHSMINNYR